MKRIETEYDQTPPPVGRKHRNSFQAAQVWCDCRFGCGGTLPSAMSVKGKEPPGPKKRALQKVEPCSGRLYLYAMAIIDFASAGNLPTRLNSTNLNPASRSNLSSVRKDQNLI
jgi:hypothetical protein